MLVTWKAHLTQKERRYRGGSIVNSVLTVTKHARIAGEVSRFSANLWVSQQTHQAIARSSLP